MLRLRSKKKDRASFLLLLASAQAKMHRMYEGALAFFTPMMVLWLFKQRQYKNGFFRKVLFLLNAASMLLNMLTLKLGFGSELHASERIKRYKDYLDRALGVMVVCAEVSGKWYTYRALKPVPHACFDAGHGIQVIPQPDSGHALKGL